MANDNTTIIIKDVKSALESSEREALKKPAALIALGGEINGTIFDLVGSPIMVGARPDNTIPLEFEGISRYHFKLIPTGDSYIISDSGSRNGTYVNNEKIQSDVLLQKGDLIKLGTITLKYLPKGDPERLTYDKLNLEANTDKHTGCFNKTYFNNKIHLEVNKCKITGNPLSLIVLDLDHFKKINDNFGHDAGDFVLKELANLLRKHGIREDDVFARYGGEEFVILLPKTNLKQSCEIAERLRRLVEAKDFIYDHKKLPVTASIGVSDYRNGVLTGTDLFKRADEAVYKSKQNGRNQVNFYREP